MHFRYVLGGLFVLASLFLSSIQAQNQGYDQVRVDLISLDVREKPFSEIIEGIREQTRSNIIYDEEVKEISVTIKLIQVHWKKVLEIIARDHNCLVEQLDDNVLKVSKPPTVTMEFDGADIRDVINQIATIANKNIVISEEVQGSVTLRLQNVSWRDALGAIIKNGGYVLVNEADGKILRVVPPSEIQAQLETDIFKLRYIRPKSKYVATMVNQFFKEETANLAEQAGEGVQFSSFSLLTALKAVVTPGRGKITYDEGTNTLVITDVKPKLDKMATIIKELDTEPGQVYVDVKFVFTTNQDLFDFGLGFGQGGINITQSFGSLTTRLPFTLGEGGFEDQIAAATEAELEAGLPTDANIIEQRGGTPDSAATFGQLNMANTQILLKLLKRDVKTKIIQSPKIITLDNHEATIFVGDAISFAKSEIIQNDNGTTSVELVEAENSPARQGFQILLVPHVIPGTNKVQLTVIPANDQLIGNDPEIPGLNRFESAGSEILLPHLRTQVIVTHMILESGQTAVVGGLLTVNQSETIDKVPFLGDLPFLGYLFKNKNVNKNKEDLYIFITPRIVKSAEDTGARINATQNDYQKREAPEFETIWGGNESGTNGDGN